MGNIELSEFVRVRKYSVGASHGFVLPTVGKVFLFTVGLNVLFILAYRVAVLVQLAGIGVGDSNYDTDHIWFMCLTLETAVFMSYFAVDSVYTENHYELVSFVICAVILGLRSLLEYLSRDPEAGDLCVDQTGLESFCVASTVMQGVFTLLYLVIAPFVWKSYGWRFYKVVGSDAKLNTMWLHYQQFMALKFLDLSFILLVLTTGVIYLAFSVYGSIVSALYLFLELFWMRLGTVGIERENDNAMRVWLVLAFMSPLYILFFVLVAKEEILPTTGSSSVISSNNGTISGSNSTTTGMSEYSSAMGNPVIVGKMIVLAVLALINRIASIIWGYMGWNMFGNGMIDKVFPRMLRGAGKAGV